MCMCMCARVCVCVYVCALHTASPIWSAIIELLPCAIFANGPSMCVVCVCERDRETRVRACTDENFIRSILRAHKHTHIHTHTHTHTHLCIHIHTYTHAHTHTPACTNTGVPSNVCISVGIKASFINTHRAPVTPKSSAVIGTPFCVCVCVCM